jgi:hypothetical protein
MPDLDPIVSTVKEIDLPVKDGVGVTIHFGDGQVALLDPGNPQTAAYVEILEELKTMGDPVYVTIDRASGVVSLLLIPLVVSVTNVSTPSAGDIEVEVEPSAARHILRATAPNAKESLNVLRKAMAEGLTVVLTETEEDHEIIDVRLATNPRAPATELLPPASIEQVIVELNKVTRKRAHELFELVANTSCDPIAVPNGCIPFSYPDDGCWARAHEMCRVILAAGENVGKYWIYGKLKVQTANNPKCTVSWIWHVAPVLLVDKKPTPEVQVVDPALFREPVSDSRWKSAQHDAKAKLVSTDAAVFLRVPKGRCMYDTTYGKTQRALQRYRLKLKLRSSSHWGPPPYSQCD